VHPGHVVLGLCGGGRSGLGLLLGLTSGGSLSGRGLTLLRLLLVAQVRKLGLGGLGGLGGHRATVGRHVVLVGLKGLQDGLLVNLVVLRRHVTSLLEGLGHAHRSRARHLLALVAQRGIVLLDVGLEGVADMLGGLDPPGRLTLGGIRVYLLGLLGGLLARLDGLALEAIGDGHNQVQPLLRAEALGHGNNLGDAGGHFGL